MLLGKFCSFSAISILPRGCVGGGKLKLKLTQPQVEHKASAKLGDISIFLYSIYPLMDKNGNIPEQIPKFTHNLYPPVLLHTLDPQIPIPPFPSLIPGSDKLPSSHSLVTTILKTLKRKGVPSHVSNAEANPFPKE
jgi:hypothetical protein